MNSSSLFYLVFFYAGSCAVAQTGVETVIHNFGYFPKGAAPYGVLVEDGAGSLYGTASQGGLWAQGAVFRLDMAGDYTLLYSFTGGNDGAIPDAGVILDASGNLYGTTYSGGWSGHGVVYKLDASGHETVLHSFTGNEDGGNPYAGVFADASGNLFGTTVNGGRSESGVVYRLDPLGNETVLYSFTGGDDGANPYAGVLADGEGNLYGTTRAGGRGEAGVLYKLGPAGRETVLHDFGPPAGNAPTGGVFRDGEGNLYGTASTVVYQFDAEGRYRVLHDLPYAEVGGTSSSTLVRDAAGNLYGTTGPAWSELPTHAPFGTVFKLSPGNDLTAIYDFPGAPQAGLTAFGPNAGVLLDSSGNIYGVTPYGGTGGMIYQVNANGSAASLFSMPAAHLGSEPRAALTVGPAGDFYGATTTGGLFNAGTVYRMNAAGHEELLYAFSGGMDGAYPQSAVVIDALGNAYGTTEFGGASDQGVVYKIDPAGNETVLHSFTGGADGGNPTGSLILDRDGNLYGTTFGGGTGSLTGLAEGVVFELNAAGEETVLYSFTGLGDGGGPASGVTRDPQGNLYGTTVDGGAGAGVIYQITPAGKQTVLYCFGGGPDGGNPYAGLTRDDAGNLYGTTLNFGPGGGGVVFELTASHSFEVLYGFAAGLGGNSPFSGVIRDAAGNLYGTNDYGGGPGCIFGCGVVYQITVSGQEMVLHSFSGAEDGGNPFAGVLFDGMGNLLGTTTVGGVRGGGVVYRIGIH